MASDGLTTRVRASLWAVAAEIKSLPVCALLVARTLIEREREKTNRHSKGVSPDSPPPKEEAARLNAGKEPNIEAKKKTHII